MEQNPQELKVGEMCSIGNYQIRNFKGYRQSREGTSGNWKFYISGFDGTTFGKAGNCTVLLANGSYDSVPIDARNRITIDGQKYTDRHWAH